jgi:hypothetical protein
LLHGERQLAFGASLAYSGQLRVAESAVGAGFFWTGIREQPQYFRGDCIMPKKPKKPKVTSVINGNNFFSFSIGAKLIIEILTFVQFDPTNTADPAFLNLHISGADLNILKATRVDSGVPQLDRPIIIAGPATINVIATPPSQTYLAYLVRSA